MTGQVLVAAFAVLLVLAFAAFAAWRRYLWASEAPAPHPTDDCPYSLTETFGEQQLLNVPHQQGVRWLTEVFSRSAERYPELTALQIPHTGESLSFAELDARANDIAAALSPWLTGPDQVVAVAMAQDNWQIVAAHLGILKAGGTMMFLDTTLPEALITHMLADAEPVVVLTRGQRGFRDLATIDTLSVPPNRPRCAPPAWLDDPSQRLATLFYTSGTTGMPKGVECPHAGYVNLALSYADYLDLVPGMDATTLTSSLGYDGSISEMYSAWVSGCAVVMLTKEQVRAGPDLLPVLRDAEVTVLFCPPVLLTTLTAAPERDLPYPLCRYIVPAGEAFPAALVEPWTRCRRQVINTYGPTEASTDTSRQSLRPGEPVTIGAPLANVRYVILEPGSDRALPHGEAGELCIGGVQLARGYRRLPQQTARQFITHPRFGRLYRTGDRCRIDIEAQQVEFLGRIDAQLKVRGHRVETQPVEDLLQTRFPAIEAAVLDYQNQELVAFVVAPSLRGTDASAVAPALAPAPSEWAKQVTATLAEQLPAPSVPTRLFLVEQFVLKPVSGKIDRSRLPKLSQLTGKSEPHGEPESEPNRPANHNTDPPPGSDEVLTLCREIVETPLGWDDRFADHGGHSIVIAELAARLQDAGWEVSVRALLSDCDTARQVAQRPRKRLRPSEITATPGRNHDQRDEAAARTLPVAWFTTLQVLFVALLYFPPLAGFLGAVAFAEIGEFFMTAQLWEFAAVGLLGYLFALSLPFGGLLWVLLIKRAIGGDPYRNNITPGTYPKWSRMHLRIWAIGRLETAVLRPLGTLFRSAPLLAYALRRLGARVGDNLQCAQDVEFSGPLDLISIGDDVTIQTGACIHTSRWVGQDLQVGPVRLDSGCTIGMRAGVADHVTVGRGSWVTPLTAVLDDVGAAEVLEGAPARSIGRRTPLKRVSDRCRTRWPAWATETLNILMQVWLDFLLLIVPAAAVSWLATSFISDQSTGHSANYFSTTPLAEIAVQFGLYTFITTWVAIVLVSVLGCLFVRVTAFKPGLYDPGGFKGALLLYRVKTMNRIQRLWTWTITGQYLRALAGVRFTRVGASECDVMFNLVPELASADARTFWSHGCYTNMLDQDAGYLNLRQLDMPANFFSSNNCVAESGHFPTNFLLGVSTPGNDIRFRLQMRARPGAPITVAGNPPVRFASADFDAEHQAQRPPTLALFLTRVFLNDVFSIGMLRITHVLIYTLLFTALLRWGGSVIVSAALALLFAEGLLIASSVAVKRLLVGSRWGRDHATPFWSWRHFSYFFAQDCFFAWCRAPFRILAGTLLSNTLLRWMGCRVGQRTLFTAPMQAFDWNAVKVGNDCVIAGNLQLHSFEGMMLKVKQTSIGDGSVVNFGATVMGGASIEPGTTLLPLSLVLKEMRLPAGLCQGSPAEPCATDRMTNIPDHCEQPTRPCQFD